MPELELPIRNPTGLHARPAATFVRAAAGYDADIRLANLDGDPSRVVSAKSLIGVLSIGAAKGHRIRLIAEGPDQAEALQQLAALVDSGLGEAPPSVEPA
jgi:phosphoenolpyruvate---glycerone phosphotransferase subunit DhaM